MSDTNQVETTTTNATEQTANEPVNGQPRVFSGINPFQESSAPPQSGMRVIDTTAPAVETPAATVVTEPVKDTTVVEEPDNIVDADKYLKDELGYDTWEAAKNEIKELRELREKAKTPEEIKFANEASQKLFEAWKEGKEDDVYSFLAEKRQLERAEKLDVTKVSDAAEIIKLNMQYKNKNLTADEIDYLYNKNYSLPEKPEQGIDETDDEYKSTLSKWEKDVRLAEKDLIIQAKLAKPELSKYKQELVAPEIPKKETSQEPVGPTQEELAVIQKNREEYLQSLPTSLKEFSGFTTTAKNEDVEIPVSYAIAEDEKVALQKEMENFDPMSFLESRWVTKEGKLDAKLMAADIYLLRNSGKVFQKIANESSAQTMSHSIKTKKNISIGSGGQQGNPVLGSPPVTKNGTTVIPNTAMAEHFFKN